MGTRDSDSELTSDHDSVTAELDSMRQIARALDALHDEETRRRVLQWAHDRYRPAVATAPPGNGAMSVSSSDPALAVGTLAELFEAAPAAAAPAARVEAEPPCGVESMIKDFAADFRRFALEWQGA